MDKIWLKSYPKGIPAEIDVRAYASLKDILEQSCARYRDLPAFSNMGTTLTYGQLDAMSRAFGAYLQQASGLSKGDRVALMMPNLLQYPVTHVRRPAGGHDGGQRQPALHAARAASTSSRTRAPR